MFSGIIRKVRCGALILGTFLAGASILLATPVFAATGINEQLNFQGRLLNAQGATAPDGYYNVEFKLYQDGSGTTAGNPGGTLLWTEAWLNSGSHGVVVRNGYISVQLGSINPFGNSVDWNQDTIWLSVNIGDTSSCTIATDFNTDCGGDGEMLPMKRMSAVPYALNAAKLGGLTAAGFIQNTTTVQTSTNMTIDGTARADTGVLTPAVDTNTATALNIGTTNATSINLNQNVIVAADKTLTLTGGATRPASPTEGMLWYDTTTKQLLIYANGKWQADRSTSTKIVAASNASQALKDSADYVADGTGDQTEINAALTAAAGGKVYLTEGTYTISASISIPNNTTLAGAGTGTIITIPNSYNASINAITNTTTGGSGTGVAVQDLELEGNKSNQTAGVMAGIVFNGVGSSTAQGGKIANVRSNNWYGPGGASIALTASYNTIITGNFVQASDNGIYLVNGGNNTVISNVIQTNAYGIRVNGSANNTISSNTVLNNTNYGIRIYTSANNNAITGNSIQNNSNYNIAIQSSDNTTVTGNTVTTGTQGIYLQTATNTTVTGNTVTSHSSYGIQLLTSANNNTVTSNKLTENGGNTYSDALYIDASDNNTIASNIITDTAHSSTNYAINIFNATSDTNQLANNILGGGSINDSGTGTIYANQVDVNGKLINKTAGGMSVQAMTNDTAAFTVQNAAGSNIFAVDTTNNKVVLGNSTAAGTIAMSDGSGYTATITMTTLTANRKFLLPDTSLATDASPATICVYNGTSSNCPAATGSTFYLWNSTSVQDGTNYYLRSASAGSVVGVLEGASGQTADLLRFNTYNGTTSTTVARFTAGGDLQVAASVDTNTATALNIGTNNATSINLNQSTVISADKALTLTGGTTRPASPTEGMLWYDTTTKQLLVYSNGKWQADRSTATKIVAASNSSQAAKDGADYVADGEAVIGTGTIDGDQAQINAAIAALPANGGSIYLTEGTYYIDASIVLPSNIKLSGAGNATAISVNNTFGAALTMVTNSDTTNGNTNITIRDVMFDGNDTNNNTAIAAISFTRVGTGTGATAVPGANITGTTFDDLLGDAISFSTSNNNRVTNNIISNVASEGIQIVTGVNNIVSGNALTNVDHGIAFSAVTHSTISNNSIDTSSSANGAIDLASASQHNVVTGNSLKNNTNISLRIATSSNNTVTSNVFADNGGSGAVTALAIQGNSNDNVISNNTFRDTVGTGYAIDVDNAAADRTVLQGNSLYGTGATSINDLGTGTVYGGQVNTSGNYVIQPAGTIELLKNTNVTGTLSASTSVLTPTVDVASAGTLSIGTSTATAITIGKAGVTTTIAGDTGVTLNATTGTTMVCRNTSGLLSTCDATYVAPTATNFIQNQNGSLQTGNFRISGTGQADTSILTPLVDTATAVALNIGTTNATAINIGSNAAAHTINIGNDATTVQTVNIGSKYGTSATTVSAGSGGLHIDLQTGMEIYAGGALKLGINTSTFMASNNVYSLQDTAGETFIGADEGTGTVTIGWSKTLDVAGGAIFQNGLNVQAATGSNTFTTPLGFDTSTKVNLSTQDLGSYASVMALGISSGSNATARGIVIADGRTSAHQATIGVLSPDENQIFGLSWDGSNTVARFKNSASTIALQGGGVDLLTTSLSGSDAVTTLGVAGANTGKLTLATASNSNTVTLASAAQTGNYTLSIPALSANDTICLQGLANCGSTLTVGALDGGTANGTGATLNAGVLYLQSASDTNPGLVNTAAQTFAGAKTFNDSITLATGKTINMTGDTTANRPANPTEGMLYYDASIHQLLVYNNSKWKADGSDAILVAASDSSQADKDAANYVADGNTAAVGDGDQVQINQALTAAAGKKVVLLAGTYVADATILIPNNTTLAGVGDGTSIQLADLDATDNLIENSDTTTGTGVTIRDLKLDGQDTANTAGTQYGIYLNNMGDYSASRTGATMQNIEVSNFRSAGIFFWSSDNNTVSDSTVKGMDAGGATLGIYFDSSPRNNIISNNVFSSNSYAIRADGSGSSNNSFTDNTFRSNSYGIMLYDATNSTISGNNFDATANHSVDLYSNSTVSTYNSVTGNSFRGDGKAIVIDNTSYNLVSGNKIHDDGGTTNNNAIVINNDSDNNTITSNAITDSSATVDNYAISITSTSADANYLADNTLGGGTINNAGTGTIYGGQVNAAGNFLIQPAGTIELQKNTNVTGTISGTSSLTLGTSSSTNGTLALKNSTNANTVTLYSLAQTGNYTLSIPILTNNDTVCLQGLANCGSTLTVGALDGGTANGTGATLNAGVLYLQSASDTNPGLVNTAAQTFAGAKTFNDSITLATGKTINMTGDTTANRPASPTEGMVYYDTSTKQLLIYANGKWQSDRSTSTKIVAASNASQALKDGADYVAPGTGDQTVINSALTAAAGGKVYLTEGTFTTSDAISIPNNTTLAGAGRGTLIQFANLSGASKNMVTNTDTSTGEGVTIRDLRLDGNRTVNTSGTMHGVYFNNVGTLATSAARQGATVTNIWANNFYGTGIYLHESANSTVLGNTAQYNYLDGINIDSASRDNVSNNILLANDGWGVHVSGALAIIVNGNNFGGNGAKSGSTSSGGLLFDGSSQNNAITNNVFRDNGTGTGASNPSIAFSSASNNTVTGNVIADASGTTGYAIYIINAASTNNYFATNAINGTFTSAILDVGTGTIYGGQTNGSNSTGNYLIQPAGTIELLKNTNVTGTLSASTSVLTPTVDVASAGTLSIGTSTATAISIGKAGVTTTIAGNTGVTLNATTGTTMVCRNTSGLLSTCDATYVAPTATNFIQNQNGSLQTGNFRISGTGQADTSILTPLVDTATATTLNIGTTNATGINLGKSAIATNLKSSTVTVGTSGASTTISGATQTTNNTTGNTMTIKGSDGLGTGNGGAVTLQAGNAGVSGTYGGNLTLAGGTGTTSNGLVILGTSAFQTVTNDSNCYPSGTESTSTSNCTIAQSSVNNNAAVLVGFTNDGQTAFMPDPSIVTAGRVVYVTASSLTKDFTLSVNGGGTGNTIAMRKNTTATMIWNGADWTAAGASSSTTLQAAYDNTLQSAGGAELVVSKTTATNGLTIRDASGANAVNGTLLSIQTSSAANLLTVNSNVTEYTSNSGAETYSGTTTTFPSSTWVALTGATVTRNVTTTNIATGQGSAQVVTSTSALSGVKNVLNTSLTAGQHYNVSFSAKLSSGTFTDMGVYYSVDGSTDSVACTTGQAIKTSVWTKVNCIFTAPSSGITSSNSINIRQVGSGTARTFYVDNISVTIAADYNYATDGGVNDNTNFGTNWTSVGTATVARYTSDGEEASDSAQVSAGTTANNGVKNKLSINPLTSTLYRVSVYAKLTAGSAFTDFKVRYTPDNGTNFVDCVDYNTQTVVTTGWTQITCYINTSTTTVSNPYVQFIQPTAPGSARAFLIDAFSMTLASNTTPNVQVGSGSNGGPTTLFTLDKAASAPIAANNDALLGSMYYDTTLGKLQCYEADGWGACGSSPDNIVTISPEYTNAVMHGTGVGTMTSDFCSDMLNINDPTNAPAICGANETYNFYKWTSPQPTTQTYSIYVTYQLPSTFKAFASGQTSLMGKTDSANSSVTYQVYRNNTSSGLSACGGIVSVSTGVQTAWQTAVATGAADPSTCGFAAGDSIVFKINVSAASNADAYVGNLGFTFSNK